jgi:hypothetical protein
MVVYQACIGGGSGSPSRPPRTAYSELAFTLGGLAAIAAFMSGMVLIVPAVSVQTAVGTELAATDADPTPAQQERLA